MTRLLFFMTVCLLLNESSAVPIRPIKQGQILFVAKKGATYQLFTVNTDGSGLKQLTKNADHYVFGTWSPDGKKIVYGVQEGKSITRLFLMNADGTNVKPLTTGNVYDRGPAWSPDGKKLAFTRRIRDRTYDVVVIDLTTEKVLNLTRNPAFDADPAWSPDGKKIAFTSSRSGQGFLLYLMASDGTDLRQITKNPNRIGFVYPAWSPDGNRIAYAEQVGNAIELCICDADGGNRQQITSLKGVNTYPTWSPKGDSLLFTHTDQGKTDGELYELNLKTNRARPLGLELPVPVEGGRPAWRHR